MLSRVNELLMSISNLERRTGSQSTVPIHNSNKTNNRIDTRSTAYTAEYINMDISRYITFERTMYLHMMTVGRWARRTIVILADLPINAYLNQERQHARDTGFGISAPNAYRFIDVLRKDWAMVVALFSLIAFLSRLLYFIIAPPSIFAIEYTLAILFLFYSIGVLVLTYQAIRDTEYPTRIDELRPERFERFEKCAICQEDSPYEKLIEIHCRASDERTPPVRHAFHEDCIIKSWEARMVFANAGQEYQCPICRQEPNGYNRRFGPPRPNIFDNSRLMWYINSLFTRRLVLVMRNFTRRPRYVFQGHPYSANTIYYIQLLPKVLLVHLFLVLTLLFYIRFATLTFFLPFSWSVWIVVLGISIAFLNKFSEITHDRLYEVAYNGIFRIGLVVFDFIDFFAYLLPTRAPPAPNPPNDGRPVRDGLNNGGANNGGANNDAPNNNVPDNGAPNENVDILIDIDDNEANDGERDGADESDDGDDDDGLPYRLTPLQFAQVYVRVVWFYTNRLIWFVGCHVIFDLTKYVALNISRFVMLVALYNVVVFLFFALESPLVTPSTASN